MSSTRPSWLHRLIWRRYLIIAGILAWGFGSNLLRTGQEMVVQLSRHLLVADSAIRMGIFFLFLVNDLTWIAGSLAVLRFLARKPTIRQCIEQRWWATPLLLQTVVFTLHWVVALSYILITGDMERGVVLGWTSWLQILLLLTIGPICVER